MACAMIFAAGRGERMRPLTDHCPKPLLEAGGKPLIVWQIEALARAGLRRIVINHAWLGERFELALGDGSRFGVTLRYSSEEVGLETAGGVAHARPLLEADGSTIIVAVSGDVFSDYDYHALAPRIAAMEARARAGAAASMHLVMVPNPPYHPEGDFALTRDRLTLADGERLTFGNIGVYDLRLFDGIADGQRLAMTPLYKAAISAGRATGERFTGRWENVGTPAQLDALDRTLRVAGDLPPSHRLSG